VSGFTFAHWQWYCCRHVAKLAQSDVIWCCTSDAEWVFDHPVLFLVLSHLLLPKQAQVCIPNSITHPAVDVPAHSSFCMRLSHVIALPQIGRNASGVCHANKHDPLSPQV